MFYLVGEKKSLKLRRVILVYHFYCKPHSFIQNFSINNLEALLNHAYTLLLLLHPATAVLKSSLVPEDTAKYKRLTKF
jgi:hypothetical protein